MEKIYPAEETEMHEDESDINKLSEIQQYYDGSTIFVTGATGFLGRILVEKLLRVCYDLNKIYILMRPKRDKTIDKRFEEYFNDPLYDRLKRDQPNSMQKIHIMLGDCSLPNLGLSEIDKNIFTSEVNCVFHLAASVRFNEKLRNASNINVRGTRDILNMCKETKNLRSVVYVSTAYSYCPRSEIDEVFYTPILKGTDLLTLVDTLNDDMLEAILPTLKGEWPNTYAFTKSLAENVVQITGANLPVAIVRPSIVVGTSKDPLSGWINNYNGATGIFVGTAVGLIRTLQCDRHNIADIVPADYVVNSAIAAAWDVANTKTLNLNKEVSEITEATKSDAPIYNYVSSVQKPTTWDNIMSIGLRHVDELPTSLQVWHYFFYPVPNRYLFLFLHILFHYIPAYIVDAGAFCIGKKPQLVEGYKKISKSMDVLTYFASHQWKFHNDNTQKLWNKLTYKDRKMFDFDMNQHDWDEYFKTFVRGARVYLLKDPMETVAHAVAKRFRLKIAHYVLVCFLIFGLYKLLMVLLEPLFSI